MKKLFFTTAVLLSAILMGNRAVAALVYQISDEEAKQWVLEANKVERCLFPSAFKNKSVEHLSPQERWLHSKYVVTQPLIQILGEEKVKIIDRPYLEQQINKFNNFNPVKYTKKWCYNLKS